MKKTALFMAFALMVSVFANAQTKTEIKPSDLPKGISENISKEFSGFAIQNACKVLKDNQTTYEVIVEKGITKEKLCYNAEGKLLKKEAMEHATAQKSAATGSTAPKSATKLTSTAAPKKDAAKK